jgi:hypothetical protein
MVKSIRTAVVVIALALVAAVPRLTATSGLSQLRGIQELKEWFNAYKGQPRLILLLSPT